MLRVTPVPNPPAGTDWQYTIPGQYLLDVTSINAAFTPAGGAPTVAVDATGNGNDGLYVQTGTTQFWDYPGAIPPDPAFLAGDQTTDTPSAYMFFPSAGPTFDPFGDFTAECFVNSADAGVKDSFVAQTGNGAEPVEFFVGAAGDGAIQFRWGTFSGFWSTAPGVFPYDGMWHWVVWQLSGVTGHILLDGVEVPSAQVAPPGPRSAGGCLVYVGAIGGVAQSTVAVDEFAIYAYAPTVAAMQAHYAARGDLTTYTNAVLFDGPDAYFHFDDLGPLAGTDVFLDVTDGTHLVGEWPTGFAAPTVEPDIYSWIVGLSTNTQVGPTVTVGLPQLVVPAGYTIGTRTPAIGAGDQWSDIVIWWDDTLMNSQLGIDAFRYPPGAHLVYQQQPS